MNVFLVPVISLLQATSIVEGNPIEVCAKVTSAPEFEKSLIVELRHRDGSARK